jgi:DNA-binding MarR family transcriptional regulator
MDAMRGFPVCWRSMKQPSKKADKAGSKPVAPFDAHIPGVDYGQLDALVGYAVRRAQIRIYEDFTVALQPWNITPQRFSAMTLIHCNPGIKAIELAGIMGIARSGVAIILNALEAAGYIRRVGQQKDRRTLALELSVAGRRALREISNAVARHDARVTSRLDDAQKTLLISLLDQVGVDPAGPAA